MKKKEGGDKLKAAKQSKKDWLELWRTKLRQYEAIANDYLGKKINSHE